LCRLEAIRRECIHTAYTGIRIPIRWSMELREAVPDSGNNSRMQEGRGVRFSVNAGVGHELMPRALGATLILEVATQSKGNA